MNYIITGQNYNSSLFSKLKDVRIIRDVDLATSGLRFGYEDKLYIPNETSLEYVLPQIDSEKRKSEITTIKDKYKCRQLLASFYPDFFFTKVKLDQLGEVELDFSKKYIVKPRKGFFNTGVKKLMGQDQLKRIQTELTSELGSGAKNFSDSVITLDEVIIEELIDGEQEFAVDMYYDSEGRPVITDIQYHPIPANKDYFFVLHYTSKQLIETHFAELMKLFSQFNEGLQIKNLAIHAEFMLAQDRLVPIEFNVARFGGFGFGDIAYNIFGINPFEYFFTGKSVTQQRLTESLGGNYGGMFLFYKPKSFQGDKQTPDHQAIKAYLGNSLINYIEMDHKVNPVFAISYVKTDDKAMLDKLLNTDFEQYIIGK